MNDRPLVKNSADPNEYAVKQRWTNEAPQLAIGDLVLIVDKVAPRGFWKKAVVEEILRSNDSK
ncbi:unnamed protein product, partial [Dibothriocephalus latus]